MFAYILIPFLIDESIQTFTIGGYEILVDVFRGKAQLINLTAFEILFEFLGMNFNIPECVPH